VAIRESFQQIRKFLFLASLFITKEKGFFATGYSISKIYIFKK